VAKKVDPKAKAKRQKIIAIVGCVLLVGLLAFQVPRTMKMMNRKAPEPTPVAAPTTAVPSDPSVLPTPGSVGGSTGAAPTGSSSAGTLIRSDPAPLPRSGQLIAFGRFASKDPFKQQIDRNALGVPAAGSPTKPKPSSPSSTGGAIPTAPSTPTTPTAPAGSAVLSVNGVEETVALKGQFPKDQPLFTLVSLSGGEARVAIAGGAFASGQPTLNLKKGKAITLVNTADGTRYELKLVSVG
jgi:hypothetical protein